MTTLAFVLLSWLLSVAFFAFCTASAPVLSAPCDDGSASNEADRGIEEREVNLADHRQAAPEIPVAA